MKTAFITGGGRGIGRGFAEYLLDQDMKVFIGVRKPSTVSFSHKNLALVELDVTNDQSIGSAFAEVSQKTDHLDYLINNAGVNKSSVTDGHKELVTKLHSLDRQILLKMFDINTVSPLMLVKKFLPLLKSDPSFIINVSSDRASYHDEYENTDGNYGYRASKIALNMFTFCSLFDLPKNVKTFAVHPGGVRTDMNPEGEDDPKGQAKKMIAITENWHDDFNGKFLRYDGTLYPL